jgi:hypothetical protein
VIALQNKTESPFDIRSLYPNPFNKEIGILFNKVSLEPIIVRIFNAEGKFVLNETYSAYRNNLFINTESLDAGIYFLSVETGETKIVKRVTKY